MALYSRSDVWSPLLWDLGVLEFLFCVVGCWFDAGWLLDGLNEIWCIMYVKVWEVSSRGLGLEPHPPYRSS
jgi:hypothetical protein